MQARRPIGIMTALPLLAVALLLLPGCGRLRSAETPVEVPSASAPASQPATSIPAEQPPASATSTATPATPASGAPASPATSPTSLSSTDAQQLDKELGAIQAELDRMSLPGDSDFGSLESGLK